VVYRWTNVRALSVVFVVLAACARYGPVVDLQLAWVGVEISPQASPDVAQALARTSLAFGLRDVRPDPFTVGGYTDSAMAVRTSDNVAAYCSRQLGELLVHAGAQFAASPTAVLEAELLEFRVVEGGTFDGVVRIRVIVRGSDGQTWSHTYTGKSKRWGRTHNPENFNEALANSLAEAAQQLLQDDEFAAAIVRPPAPPGTAPPADPYPLPGPAPGSSGG
jgi:hypothetical protein